MQPLAGDYSIIKYELDQTLIDEVLEQINTLRAQLKFNEAPVIEELRAELTAR